MLLASSSRTFTVMNPHGYVLSIMLHFELVNDNLLLDATFISWTAVWLLRLVEIKQLESIAICNYLLAGAASYLLV